MQKKEKIVVLFSFLLLTATFSFSTGVTLANSAPEEEKAEYVVIILIDGLRFDALAEAEIPNIDSLIGEGVNFINASTVNLAATQVVNASLTTGRHPEAHGIITEKYLDRDTWKTVSLEKKPELLGGKTIFEVLADEGMTSTVVLGKTKLSTGARGATTILSPTIPSEVKGARYVYEVDDNAEKAFELRMQEDEIWADAGLQALENKPDVTLIWLPNVDRTAHVNGPASLWYIKAIERADSLVGDIIEKLEDLGIYEETAIILTADHGFTQTTPEFLVPFPLGVLQDAGIEHLAIGVGGKAIWLYLKSDADNQEAVNALLASDFVKEIYASTKFKDTEGIAGSIFDLRVENERSGDFLIQLAPGWTEEYANWGQHGSIYTTDIHIPLVVTGPGIVAITSEADVNLVDIAPTALFLLGIDSAKLKGQGKVLPYWALPASFVASNLKITPPAPEPGEPFFIFADITNDGDLPGSTDIPLVINGVTVDTTTVTLDPGETTKVTFTVEKDVGSYEVSVFGAPGGFGVAPREVALAPTAVWVAIVITIAVICVLGTASIVARRKR